MLCHFTSVCVFYISSLVGNIQRSDNCSQMNLSGSSSSLASETSNKNSGQRSYGIGGTYLQKKIQEITDRMTHASRGSEKRDYEADRNEAELESTNRKRLRFQRLRERSFSRERPAFASEKEADHRQATERKEKQMDINSDILSISSHGNRSQFCCFCSRLRHKRRKTIWWHMSIFIPIIHTYWSIVKYLFFSLLTNIVKLFD